MKREREFREISLREISDATKINMRILEAIEKDNYEALPGGIFNRNFIRAYAEFIGLDPEIAVRKYQVQTSQSDEPRLPPFLLTPQEKNLTASSLSPKWILGVLILVVLALLAWFLWVYAPKDLFKKGSMKNLTPIASVFTAPDFQLSSGLTL